MHRSGNRNRTAFPGNCPRCRYPLGWLKSSCQCPECGYRVSEKMLVFTGYRFPGGFNRRTVLLIGMMLTGGMLAALLPDYLLRWMPVEPAIVAIVLIGLSIALLGWRAFESRRTNGPIQVMLDGTSVQQVGRVGYRRRILLQDCHAANIDGPIQDGWWRVCVRHRSGKMLFPMWIRDIEHERVEYLRDAIDVQISSAWNKAA